MEKTRVPKEPKSVLIGKQRMTRGEASNMTKEERDLEILSVRLWNKLTRTQNAQIARELGKPAPIGYHDAKEWFYRPGNAARAEAWIDMWFLRGFRKI